MPEGQSTDSQAFQVDHLPGSEWRDLANCLESDPNLFYPAGESDEFKEQISAAKAICELCVVRDECLSYAVETNQESGIWGRLTESERRRYRKRWLADQRRDTIR